MSFDSQNPHQPLDTLAADFQRDRYAPAAKEGTIQVQFVESPQQTQVFRTLGPRLVVVGRARHCQQLALPLHRQVRVLWVDPSAPLVNR